MTLHITIYETTGGDFHLSISSSDKNKTKTGSRAVVEREAEKWIREYLDKRQGV